MRKMSESEFEGAVLIEARYQFQEMQVNGRPFRDAELPLIDFAELQVQFPEIARAFLEEARGTVAREAMVAA